jgi:hypothetical protein
MIKTKTHLTGIDYCDQELMITYTYYENDEFAPFGDVDIYKIEIENIDMTYILEPHEEYIKEIIIKKHQSNF